MVNVLGTGRFDSLPPVTVAIGLTKVWHILLPYAPGISLCGLSCAVTLDDHARAATCDQRILDRVRT